eukprot:3019544-Pyramimonas_sp.AAC.1
MVAWSATRSRCSPRRGASSLSYGERPPLRLQLDRYTASSAVGIDGFHMRHFSMISGPGISALCMILQ